MKKFLVTILSLVLLSTSAYAAKDPDAPAADCEGLRVATGPAGKGFSKMFADMKRISSSSKLNLCEVTSEGSLDNLSVLSTKGADVGLVMSDSLKTMALTDENIAALKVVAVLNNSYLHIVTSTTGYTYEGPRKMRGLMKGDPIVENITRFSQLRGKPVALVGTAQLMVRLIDKQAGLNMSYIDVPTDSKAFELVKNNTVAAAFTVAGWPAGPIKNLRSADNLTLVHFDIPAVNSNYGVKPLHYRNVGVYNVQCLFVRNLLVTRSFSTAEKNSAVSSLKSIISSNLPALKDGDFEPGWNEITSLDANVDWPKFKQ
ncbi:MAG TPA: hypothetical protein VFK88_12020 [Gallionella sp.]|nr:hypothetical protein [Gallionella sp.]